MSSLNYVRRNSGMNLLSKQLKNSVKYLENSFKKSEKWNLN